MLQRKSKGKGKGFLSHKRNCQNFLCAVTFCREGMVSPRAHSLLPLTTPSYVCGAFLAEAHDV
eukprot:c16233_g2_i1 orf=74-262(+)